MTTTTQRSTFDTGNWSEVNGLPGQNDIINYLEHLFTSNPHETYTRRQLMDKVAIEFGIPTVAQEAEGPKSHTPGYYTRMTYLITDSVQGKRRATAAFAKRIAFGVYQHISGSGQLPVFLRKAPKVSTKLVEQARVSVRILKGLNHDADTILGELGGKIWSDDVIGAAIAFEFPIGKTS
jgi:hypothetical protein